MRYNFKKKDKQLLFIALVILLFCGLLVFTPLSFENIAKAVTLGNYNRGVGDEIINLDDWNNLDNDFLLTDGGNSMQGDLDMGGNRITNVSTTADPNDAANIGYVVDAIATAGTSGGGDVFVNWGRGDCPGGSDILYSGYAFSARYDSISGGNNPVCMQAGSPGEAFTGIYADEMYPLITGQTDSLPPAYSEDKIIQCALCHKPQGVCFEYVGRQDCGSSGFNAIYKGYLLGSDANNDLINGLHYNSTERLCVNDSFDANVSAGGNLGALWYGVVIEDNFSLNNYTEDAYIMCSVCCN